MKYTAAGYRWAYWQLEDKGIVILNEAIKPDAIFNADDYWSPPKDDMSEWLYKDIFPKVTDFLNDHKNCELIYVEEDKIFELWELGHDPKKV